MPSPPLTAIVAFDGVQALDVTGPWEVLNTAALIAGAPPRLRLLTPGGRPVRSESGLRLESDGDLDSVEALDTLIVAGGVGTREAVRRRAPGRIDPPPLRGRPPHRGRLHRRLPARRGRPARRPSRDHPLVQLRGARPPLPGRHGRAGPDLHPRRRRLHVRRGDGRDGPGARAGRGGPRPRGRPADGAHARRLRPPPGRAVAVLRPARPSERRAPAAAGSAGVDRRASRRRPLGPVPRRSHAPLRATARPRLPPRARRDSGRLRRADPRRAGADAARDGRRVARAGRPHAPALPAPR